jgi:hypothetical protein
VAPTQDPRTINVAVARGQFRRVNERNREILEPLIDAHITAYEAVLDEMVQAHVLVADNTALDLLGPSREAARWLVAGRAIGLARAALDLARLGYASEVLPTIRALHEATRLLDVFTLPGEDALFTKWAEGHHIKRGEIMRASRRQQEAIRAEMIRAGEKPPALTDSYFHGQYGRWSEFAHHRRRHVVDQVSARARIMVVGPHPDWRARAATIDHFGDSLAELVSVGGSALSRFLGPSWFYGRFQPSFTALMELKRKVPLSELARGSENGASGRGRTEET